MLDIRYIRDNAEKVRKATADKQLDSDIVDKVLELDEKRRDLLGRVEELRAKRNEIAKEGKASEEGKKIKEELKKIEPNLKEIEDEYQLVLYKIPNLAADDVKVGKNDTENEVLRTEGKPTKFDFTPKDHLELGEKLGIIDVERATKVSGARFTYLKGDAVLLELALVNFAMAILLKEGFEPIVPPVLILPSILRGLGYADYGQHEDWYLVIEREKKEDEVAKLEKMLNERRNAKTGDTLIFEDDYYLVGTSEHSVVPYFKDEILSKEILPKRFVSFSSCFRREGGAYGKDTKGILRLHQFDKVEMVSFTKPEDGDKEHEYLLSLEEKLFKALEIPYQVVKMCTGDLGAPAARKYDLEAWIPSQDKYRELTSTSTCTDFQARRLNIKYRERDKTEYVHTLNGTAFAIGRTIIAILENYQQKDGTVLVPKVLQKYMGKDIIGK